MTVRYLVRVAGPVSRVVTDTVTERFGPVEVRRDEFGSVLAVRVRDQPALRSLLAVLFDVGHDVVSVNRDEP
ncbi:MAG TPA: hypothetical protein VNC23_00805 [Lapillicoccus sp.]|jgi:hypothetical protein|nr:hypothetical protein [Lapillicoccus sp.]